MKTLTTSQNYVSSIVHKFGDESIFSKVLAEYIGQCALKNNLSHEEAIKILESIVNDLKEATHERI